MKRIPYLNYWKRIILIGVFVGIDLILGMAFLQQSGFSFDKNQPILSSSSIKFSNKFFHSENNDQTSPVDTDQLLELVNQYRENNGMTGLGHIAELDQVAQDMIDIFAQDNFLIENNNYDQDLIDSAQDREYQYQLIADAAIIGPKTAQEVLNLWQANENQIKNLLEEKFIHTGASSQVVLINDMESIVTVQIFAKPKEKQIETKEISYSPAPANNPVATFSPARDVPDWEVVEAINQYRADHQVHQLIVDNNLCKYAEKRVEDLIKYGGLDNHQGFKADFEDTNNLPVGIKDYSGGAIGENLASQYCINGTTGDSFVASTGTSLIEWCFDSSVKGHREAQLNNRYNAVCVRHGQNMYVVIFGE